MTHIDTRNLLAGLETSLFHECTVNAARIAVAVLFHVLTIINTIFVAAGGWKHKRMRFIILGVCERFAEPWK